MFITFIGSTSRAGICVACLKLTTLGRRTGNSLYCSECLYGVDLVPLVNNFKTNKTLIPHACLRIVDHKIQVPANALLQFLEILNATSVKISSLTYATSPLNLLFFFKGVALKVTCKKHVEMMKTQVSVTTETSSTLQTSLEEFCIFKVGICFAYFGITFATFSYILGIWITFATAACRVKTRI